MPTLNGYNFLLDYDTINATKPSIPSRHRKAAAALIVLHAVPEASLPLLEERLDAFWQAGEALDTFTVKPGTPEVDKAILKRLGNAPFTIGKENIATLLAKAYDAVDASVRKRMEEEQC